MRNFTHRWPKSGHFFSKLGYFFPIVEKGQGRHLPPPPSSYAPVTLNEVPTSRLLLPKSLWKCAGTISFWKYKPVTFNLPVQLQSLQVNFLHVEDAIGPFFEHSFYQMNQNSFVSCDVKLQERPSFYSYSVFWYLLFHKNLIVLHHGGIVFYSILTSVSNSHFH